MRPRGAGEFAARKIRKVSSSSHGALWFEADDVHMRYAVAVLAVLAVIAVAVAYDGRDASRTEVPTIELRSDEASEPAKRARPMKKGEEESAKKRKEESDGRTRSRRGAAPAPTQAPARAGEDDGDDDGD
jgi:hypothetical protein